MRAPAADLRSRPVLFIRVRSPCASLPTAFPLLALAGLWLALVIPAAAQAATPHDGASPGTVQLDQSAYTAHENQGNLTITIQRTGDLSGEEHVGYGVKRQDAQPGIDFDTINNHYITLAPGQSTYTFNVRIIDQGMNATPVKRSPTSTARGPTASAPTTTR